MPNFAPYANLVIFKSPGPSDEAHISGVLKLEPAFEAAALKLRTGLGRGWKLSTEGFVKSAPLQSHIAWLLDNALAGRSAAIRRLRGEGYWVSVFFHDVVRPDATVYAKVDEELEWLGVTFDFELERE